MTQDADVAEGIEPVFTWRPGDEFKRDGRWLEVVGVRNFVAGSIVTAYDPVENRQRTFVASPDAERRVRQVVA